jgi:hypothetical protein
MYIQYVFQTTTTESSKYFAQAYFSLIKFKYGQICKIRMDAEICKLEYGTLSMLLHT